MAFTNLKYETDAGEVFRVRVDNDKVAACGAEPAGAVDQFNLYASVGGSTRRRNTLNARVHIFTRSEPTANGLKAIQTIYVPKLTQESFNTFPTAKLQYKGNEYTFSTRRAES